MKNLIRRNSIVAVIITLLMATTFTACSSEKTVQETKDSETVEVKEEIKEEVAEEVEAEKVEVEEVAQETEVVMEESSEETVKYNTAEEWVDSLNIKIPTILIWNSDTKEGKVIENNEEYQLKENDKVLLTLLGLGQFDGFNCFPISVFDGFEQDTLKYLDILLNIQGKQEVTLELESGGKTYSNTVVLIGTSGEVDIADVEEDTSMVKEDIDVNSDLPGEEWITSIGNEIKEPFIAIWNDTEGTKKILDNEEKYQIKEDDVFFVYYPKDAYCESWHPGEISKKTTVLENGQILELNRDCIEGETMVMFSILVPEIGEIIDVSCILTE